MSFNAFFYLEAQADTMHQSGNPDEPFYYLAGPMTGIPKFNFPEFHRVAAQLRESGLNIISPAEIDDDAVEEQVALDTDGQTPTIVAQRTSFLERDIIICSMPTCQGGIFLPGWEASSGAGLESFVLDAYGKELLRYVETDQAYYLERFQREQALSNYNSLNQKARA